MTIAKIIFTLFSASLMFAQLVMAKNVDQNATDFMQTYLDGYERYLSAGDNADVAWVTEHFSEPLVMMTPKGPAPMETREKFAPNIQYFLEQTLRKNGVVKLEWNKLQIVNLSDTQVLASGLANALDKNGETVEQRASIYLLSKSDEGWAVAVNLPHSPDTVPTIK